MKITIDDRSGFCFGVVGAIARAEESLAAGRKVCSLGDIVHNRLEVQRLEQLGMATIRHEELPVLSGQTVLIRAHGEPPATYQTARANRLDIIDATCPVVARLQQVVKAARRKMDECGGEVVILGKKGHAEVVGLAGQVDGRVTVIESVGEVDRLDLSRPVYFLSQTTQSLGLFTEAAREITDRAVDKSLVTVHDTICRQVANRESHLAEFSAGHDVVVFVAGRKSSNGRVLYEVCRRANSRTYAVEDETEVETKWFDHAASVGICGATSTPKWLMTRVADHIDQTFKR